LSTQARERPSEAGEESPRRPADVRLEAVRKTFGDVVAVESVDLEIDQGEFFSLLGPSGSGKTRLLRIAGFERLDSGPVWLAPAASSPSRSPSTR
jgi:putative spermidine/putrescine transport system ATP-binding protein